MIPVYENQTLSHNKEENARLNAQARRELLKRSLDVLLAPIANHPKK